MMYAMAPADLGVRIRRARERKRWTQQELADALPPDSTGRRPSVRSVGRWERGDSVPRGVIGALEVVLGADLTSDGGEPDPAEQELRDLEHLPDDLRATFLEMYQQRVASERRRAG